MKFYEFLGELDVKETNVKQFDIEISRVTSRSREVIPGTLYVCIDGLHFDGNDFISEVKSYGATVIVTQKIDERVKKAEIPYVRVENARESLARACARFFGNPERGLIITGVTGTNGKTSTVRLISSVYDEYGLAYKDFGTLHGGMTTPDPEDFFRELKQASDRGKKYIVMEVSSHALHFDKLTGVQFENAIFTNLTHDHLDLHGNMDAYASDKRKLFGSAQNCIFNYDDSFCTFMSEKTSGRDFFCSTYNENADFYCKNVDLKGKDGVEYDLYFNGESVKIKSPLCGRFNVYNTLFAFSSCFISGIPSQYIVNGLKKTNVIKGRLEKLDLGDIGYSVFIDYAHTPDALKQLLLNLRMIKGQKGKLILLFGCGGDRDRSKRREMGKIASEYADFAVITEDNNRSEDVNDIIGGILSGFDKKTGYEIIPDRKEAICYALSKAKENDVVVFAGKGHENYIERENGKTDFDERMIVKEYFDRGKQRYDNKT